MLFLVTRRQISLATSALIRLVQTKGIAGKHRNKKRGGDLGHLHHQNPLASFSSLSIHIFFLEEKLNLICVILRLSNQWIWSSILSQNTLHTHLPYAVCCGFLRVIKHTKITTGSVCALYSRQRHATLTAEYGRRVGCHSSEVGSKYYSLTVLRCGDICNIFRVLQHEGSGATWLIYFVQKGDGSVSWCLLFVSLLPTCSVTAAFKEICVLGSYDRASWAKCEEREKTNKMQQFFYY